MTEPPTLTITSAARPHPLRAHLDDPLYRMGYLLTLGTAASAVFGFAFWVLAARWYPAHVVGLSSATISAMMFVSGVSSAGMAALLARYLPATGRRALAFIVSVYALTACLALVVGAAAARGSSFWSPSLRFLADDTAWTTGFAVAAAFWTLFSLQDGVLAGLRVAVWVPIQNGLFALAKLLLLLALAAVLPFAGPFVAWNVPAAIAVVTISVLLFRRLPPRTLESAESRELDVGRLLRTAAGNYGGGVLTLATFTLLPVLVSNARSATETAYFYVPWMIATVVQSVTVNMTVALTVEVARDEALLRRLCRRTVKQCLRLVLPISLAGCLASPLLLDAFGSAYAEAGSTLLRLLLAAAVPNVVVAVGIALARIEHRGGVVLATQAAQCFLVLGLSSVLLRGPLVINGVGIAWLASQLVVASVLLAGPLRSHLLRRT